MNIKIKEFLRYLRDLYKKYNFFSLTYFDLFFIKPLNSFQKNICLLHNKFNIKNENIVVFISSKNNYIMLKDQLLKNVDLSNFLVINIDDGSSNSQISLGKSICLEHNIVFLHNQSKGLQFGLKTLINYLNIKKYHASMVLHLTHDNYPITKNFKEIVNTIATDKLFNNFGLIGFNHLDYNQTKISILLWKLGFSVFGLAGRIALLPKSRKHQNWYSCHTITKSRSLYGDIFSVECVSDMAFLINRKNFTKFINVTDKLRLHLWADDICMQFLKNNINNICLKNTYFFNCQELKRKYKFYVNSVDGAKKDVKNSLYGPHLIYWKKKWGYDREYKNNLYSISNNYSGTLIERYIRHDINKAPIINIEKYEFN